MANGNERARLDAHAHFFYPGFVQSLPANCRRQSPDEITLYHAYAQQHGIRQVLAIGYEGEEWAQGNNDYLAAQAALHPWLRPIAFVSSPSQLTVAQLFAWQEQGFVGITSYIFSEESAASLAGVANEVWQWLVDHAWLISVNSSGEHWSGWGPILAQHPHLRLLIAHLGLPPAAPDGLSMTDAHAALASVTRLAQYPETYVKFSGLYALAEPHYAFPHSAAWPYAQVITEHFTPSRILWASDFSPALEHVSFPQTVAAVQLMPWLQDSELAAICHDNLARLLAAVDERNGTR
jgi:predicted TIM-barrel fold metal-dependent hydrolase